MKMVVEMINPGTDEIILDSSCGTGGFLVMSMNNVIRKLKKKMFGEEDINEQDLEDRDYYTQDNVFWVPESARWETLRDQAKQPDIGAIIDRAMGDIESENQSLRGKLDKRFGRTQLPEGKLGELIDLISTIGFSDNQKAGDMLGEVYEYFLGQFADEVQLETSSAPLDTGTIAGIAIACLSMSVVIGLICLSQGNKKKDLSLIHI